MKRVFLFFVMLGLLVIVGFVGTALFRDPYIIWFRPERVFHAANVSIINQVDAGRSGTKYTLQSEIGLITATGQLEPDSRLLPILSFSKDSQYSIVNSLLALTFFRLIGLFVAAVCIAAIIYEIKKNRA
jgi:hypothetical protein